MKRHWKSSLKLLMPGVLVPMLLASLMETPVHAQDPFRSGEEARDISPEVYSAFQEFFCAGRYNRSRKQLELALQASPQEPMVYALLAALSYQEGDLEAFTERGAQTLAVASELTGEDPLRGHLYEAVGYGFEAANLVLQDGVVIGLPKALPTLNNLFGAIRLAQKVNAEDPELNLLNGYMDLLLTNRDKALEQFRIAGPDYLAYRGLALAHRDLKQYNQALEAVDLALNSGCDNPEFMYLKAQILVLQGNDAAAVPLFNQALEAADQLPPPLVSQIQSERDSAERRLAEGS
jgi:tetratricopeptide (TPR) repeat protein